MTMGTMRKLVGLISDTHGLLRPEAVRALQGSHRIIHAGDVGQSGILEALRAIAPVTAVRGNVDKAVWAQSLPQSESVNIEQVSIYVVHNIDDLDIDPSAAGVKVVVSGHSHRPSVVRRDGVLFVNPGSAGPRRFKLPVSLALMSVQDQDVDVELVPLDT